MSFADIKESVLSRFLDRSARGIGIERADQLFVAENPTEEVIEAQAQGRPVTLYAKSAVGLMRKQLSRRPGNSAKAGRKARMEETYLYSTRRFPAADANVLPVGGPLPVGTYPFFTGQAGGPGGVAGFPNAIQLTLNETNMEMTGGQVPAGQRFVFSQLGITFGSGAAKGDVDQLLEACNLQFQMAGGTFNLNQGPIKFWPSGMGNHSSDSSGNGFPDIRAVRNLRIARNIGPGDVFQYAFNIPRATKSTDGTVWALSAFTNATIWLYGGWKTAVMG